MEPIKQTGLLIKFSEKDFLTGALPSAEVNPLGDWRDYVPTSEKQYKDSSFDTLSCTTFSAINTIETWINFLLKNKKFSLAQEMLLNEYVDEQGKVNFSDRFTAIMSGTTKQGNWFQAVLDSIRKDGLLPEKDFPFGGNTWEEYHDKINITEAMKLKAKKILSLIDVAYEWAGIDDSLFNTLKQAPVQAAIPKMATHAIELPKLDYIFDTYPPFLYPRNTELGYAMKILVTPKTEVTPVSTYKYFSAAEVAKWQLKPEMWAKLDKARELAGVPFVITSGLRTVGENSAIDGAAQNSSHLRGYGCDLRVKNSSERFKILKALLDVGFTRLSDRYDTHIHADCDPELPQNVAW